MSAFVVANLVGVAALGWPLVLGTARSGGQAHASDAPVVVALLVPLLVLMAVDATRGEGSRHRDTRLIALLGLLVVANALLPISQGPWGRGPMFVLPVLVGWYVGARFAFLLGTFSILASSVIAGDLGPWLPFQMFALGWLGAGAGLTRIVVRGRFPVLVLGVYAYGSSIAYGLVMTLWFWPFLDGVGFWRFYSMTSLPSDTGRAVLAIVPLVVIGAVPVGALLSRMKERFCPEIVFGEQAPS